jgi:hypothetical protein
LIPRQTKKYNPKDKAKAPKSGKQSKEDGQWSVPDGKVIPLRFAFTIQFFVVLCELELGNEVSKK